MPLMKICDIRPGMDTIEVVGRVTDMSERRQVQTRFGPADVATAILRDDTSSILVNLWRQQIDRAKEGRVVRIINAFAKIYNDRLELNIGMDGRIIPVEKK